MTLQKPIHSYGEGEGGQNVNAKKGYIIQILSSPSVFELKPQNFIGMFLKTFHRD